MISYLHGTIKDVGEKHIILLANDVGFLLYTPKTVGLMKDGKAEFFTYLHWNPENGPSFYGFQTELEKRVFLMIIECPKIGPALALNILSQIDAGEFLNVVSSQDKKTLSAINGIGDKKSEQIIVVLKHKVSKLLASGQFDLKSKKNFVQWQHLSDVLSSLGYTKLEASQAVQHLTLKFSGKSISLDQLIRSALSFLSANKV